LTIDPNHPLGNNMMTALEETAQQARDTAIHLSIDERLSDALASINFSIELYPIEAEFHLQRSISPTLISFESFLFLFRSIIYRKMKKYELATDECLLVLDKIAHDQEHKLYEQTQKQFVLIYNECSLRCLQTGFIDDAIELLNRAINQEKSFAGLYINRGG
jgi:tetratricopeptide (TPR) repeat protein